jgi:hypothetical protein
MDARQLLAVELIAEPRGLLMSNLARERDRFCDDMVRRQQVIGESQVLECAEDVDNALMMGISLRDQGEDKTGVEEDHTSDRP